MTGTEPTAYLDVDAAIGVERLQLSDYLDALDDSDTTWQAGSLCSGWTVHDVVAHLTLTTREGWWDIIKGAFAARGDFDRMTANAARARALKFTPGELIEQLRSDAGETRRTPMSSKLDPLTDLLVHGQDIARPLGTALAMPIEHVVPALDHVINSRWYGGAKRFANLSLMATDTDWSLGDGTLAVHGTAGDLLMTASGRLDALEALDGAGVAELSNRLRR